MKDFSKATPRPWRLGNEFQLRNKTHLPILPPEGTTPIVITWPLVTIVNIEDRDNADLIVTAVNNFDNMKEALEKFTILNPDHYKDIAGLINNAKQLLESIK